VLYIGLKFLAHLHQNFPYDLIFLTCSEHIYAFFIHMPFAYLQIWKTLE
jgi:hypothetical protein